MAYQSIYLSIFLFFPTILLLIKSVSMSSTVFKFCIHNKDNQVYYCKQHQGAETYFCKVFSIFLFFLSRTPR